MTSIKRGTAVTGDLFLVEHPTLDLSGPFTSHVDVIFDGVTHQVLTAADRGAFNHAGTTGSFTVGGFSGHVIEWLDHVETQAVHRYQAVAQCPSGAIGTGTYLSSTACLELIGSLRPSPTPLGVFIDPTDEVTIASAPRVAITTELGILELSPLEPDVVDSLPHWAGSPTPAGELYGGRGVDDHYWITLVTETARVIVLPAAGVDPDELAIGMVDLNATWTA